MSIKNLKKNIFVIGSVSPISNSIQKFFKNKSNLTIVGRNKVSNLNCIQWDIKNYKKIYINKSYKKKIDYIIYLAHDKYDKKLNHNNINILAFNFLIKYLKNLSPNARVIFFSSHTIYNQKFLEFPYSFVKSQIETYLTDKDFYLRIGLVYGITGDSRLKKLNLSKLLRIHILPDNITNLQPIHIDDLLKFLENLISNSKNFKNMNNVLNTIPMSLKNFLQFLNNDQTIYILIPSLITKIFTSILKIFSRSLYFELSSLTNLNYIPTDLMNQKKSNLLTKYCLINNWKILYQLLLRKNFKINDLKIIKKHFFNHAKTSDMKKIFNFYYYGYKNK